MAKSIKTKKAFAQSIKVLMEENSFSKITISDICAKCQMNRKSFYYHFKDKYDLVNWIFHTEFVTCVQSKSYKNGWDLFLEICIYFYHNKIFYLKALEISGQNSFRDYFSQILQPILLNYIKEDLCVEEDQEFFVEFFTDALLVSIEKWLKKDSAPSPKEYVYLLKQALGSVD